MSEYGDYFGQLERKFGLPAGILPAVMQVESGGNPRAVSPKGATGAFQFMPGTAQELGIDPSNVAQAALGAAQYLRQNLDRFGSPELALAAYNAGPGNIEKHGGIPPFPETQAYVRKVLDQLPQQDPPAIVQPGAGRIEVELPNGHVIDAPAGTTYEDIMERVPADWLQPVADAPVGASPLSDVGDRAAGAVVDKLEGMTPEQLDAWAQTPEGRALLDEIKGGMGMVPGGGQRKTGLERGATPSAGLQSEYIPMLVGTGLSLLTRNPYMGALTFGAGAGGTKGVQTALAGGTAGEAIEAGAKEGAVGALGGAAGAAGLQALTALGRNIVPPAARAISEWAAAKGAPSLPASKTGQAIAKGAQQTLAGDAVARAQGGKMIEFANRQIREMSGGVPDISNTATKVAGFFDRLAKGTKQAGDEAYDAVRAAVGPETPVPTPNTTQALASIADRLRASGITPDTKDAAARRIFAMAEDAAAGRTGRVWRDFYASYQDVMRASSGGKRGALKDVAPELRRAMEADMRQIGDEVGADLIGMHAEAGKRWNELVGLLKGTNIKRFSGVQSNPEGFMRGLMTEVNAPLLSRLERLNPELHQEALDAGTAGILSRFSTTASDTGQSIINGPKLAEFVNANRRWLADVYGPERVKALTNFAGWAERAFPMMSKSANSTGMGALAERGMRGALTGGVSTVGSPALAGLMEGGTALIARSLVNPNGALFKLFSGMPMRGRLAIPAAGSAGLTFAGPQADDGGRRGRNIATPPRMPRGE